MAKDTIRFLRVRDLPHLELYQGVDVTRSVNRHIHLVFSLSVAEAGVRCHETREGKYWVTPGDIVVVNYGEAHSGGVPAGNSFSSRSLRLGRSLLHDLGEKIGVRLAALRLRQPVVKDPELARQVLALHGLMAVPEAKLAKECLLLDVFAKLWSRHAQAGPLAPPGDERTAVARACGYLQDCMSENVSIDKLAEISGLSPFHLARVFARETGVPPHAYQLQVRLKKATDLLAAGRPLVEVALETGFCDQSHFQRAFKKKFGITPGQYER